ncbi:cytochrome c oxidase subunit 2A [Pseudalkalibacillus sp. R45]|uniref:cytochrome c oxidase subunit 2A n=1 Tax=Pseudalkalibacillus sp. R45 TaxID=3457433 RepID=UPI003FCD60D4
MEPKVGNKTEVKELKATQKAEKTLKGTFLSVLFVGGFIVLSWVGIYVLFLSRL